MQLVWAHGPVTAEAVREQLARRLKESAVPTVLRRLEYYEAAARGRGRAKKTGHGVLMSVRRIVPNISSVDPSAARSFYQGVLGLETAMDLGWIITFASPSNPTAQVSVVASGTRHEPHADISVEVADVDACHAAAQERGLSIVYPLTHEPWGVRRFFVHDPDGTVVNVLSHKGR